MRAEAVPIVLLGMLAGLVVTGAVRSSGSRARHRAAIVAQQTQVTADDSERGITRKAIAPRGEVQATPPAEMRRRVSNLAPGTYVDEILAEQDSVLYRWPDRLGDPVRVFIEPASPAAGWSPQYPEMARLVFDEWSLAGFPVRFSFVYDSASADIGIHWIERFPVDAGQRIGETDREQTSTNLIAKARLTIANHDSAGHPLSETQVAGVVRHEVGHALGLNHASVPSSVMYRESATSTIGDADRRTLRLLYLVPAGSLKD